VPTCDTNGSQLRGSMTRAAYGASKGYPAPYTCLKDYHQDVPSKSAESGLCNGMSGGNKSSAQIIYEVGQSCGVSSKVLIVLLQKEQSLITDDWPWTIQYRSATGYGCPDTAPCDAEYYGFFNQVYNAARQFKRYGRDSSSFTYQAGRNNTVYYNPGPCQTRDGAGNCTLYYGRFGNRPDIEYCGKTTFFIRNQATAGLYNYTPYQPNAEALANLYGEGNVCSSYGNRNFWRMFNDWFGITILPAAIKSPSSSTVYLYTNGFKISVPSMAMLQDYGINPGAIQTVDQATFNAIPPPDSSSQVSSSLSYLAKSTSDLDDDGGAVYLISVGRKYSIQSMGQFNDYGFNTANISYLPYNYLQSLPGGEGLTSYIVTPTSNVFQVDVAKKRIIFDYATYLSLNPSNTATFVSNFVASQVVSGDPISNREILVRRNSGAIYLLNVGAYYSLPSLDVFNCWGLDAALNVPLYTVADDSYIGPIAATNALSCIVKDASNAIYILNQTSRYSVPSGYGTFTSQALNSSLSSVVSRLATSGSLKQVVRTPGSPAIWWLESGSKRAIPSMSNFSLLGLSLGQVDAVAAPALNAIPSSGVKLGTGQLVKSDQSSAVYAISANARLLFATGEDFEAYHNTWSNIETYGTSTLNTLYPYSGTTISRYFYDQAGNRSYLVDKHGCFLLDATLLARYGQSQASLASGQIYNKSVFPDLNLSSCSTGGAYVKQYGQGTVYWVDNGIRHSFSSWSSLVAHNNQTVPRIIELSLPTIQSWPLGAAL
jgi:hypothetical protein